MKLLYGYIHSSGSFEEPKTTFLARHRLALAVTVSIFAHLAYLGWSFYESVFAPFTEIGIVDSAYNEVRWIEIAKLAKPLKYPSALLPHPGRAVPLDQVKPERPKPKKKLSDELKAEPEADKSADKSKDVAEDAVEKDEPRPTQARFGLINARPIREIVGRVYAVYKGGGLDLKEAVFSIQLGFQIAEDGSISHLELLKSSGSEQIDAAALNIANAIGASNALMPLAVLNSNTATLVLTHTEVSLEIAGSASTTVAASDLATSFSQQLAGLRFLMSLRNQDAAQMLSHLTVSNEQNQLIARLKMSRAEASALMQKNFNVQVSPATEPSSHQDESSQSR